VAKATIDDIDVAGQRVLLRVDFNVPMRDGHVVDDWRIRESLPTIEALVSRSARVIVVTHLDRPGGKVDDTLRVAPIADRLAELLGNPVATASDVVGDDARRVVLGLQDGDVGMLENVRFEPGEEENDGRFVRKLASFGDVFVNDAFGSAHRAHASTEGVAHRLPAVAGLLMARELEALGGVLEHPREPVVAIIGGAKVSTKLGVLTNLLDRVDVIWVGGAMASTFFRALDVGTGTSRVEADQVDTARRILHESHTRRAYIRLPMDVVVAPSAVEGVETRVVSFEKIPADAIVVDIGPETAERIRRDSEHAGTVVWNGPLGIYEIPSFAKGTRAVAEALGRTSATTIAGGGDLVAALQDSGVADKISHISTGGGATVEFLEGKTLPGVAALRDRETEQA